MAAGRVDVRRRIDVEKLNRGYVRTSPVKNGYDETYNRKNSASLHKNKFDLGPRRCGLDDVSRDDGVHKFNLGPRRCGLDDVSRDDVQQPQQKRRKFSPIVWDREVLSKNRVVAKATNHVDKKQPDPANLIKEVEQFQDDEQEKGLTGKEKVEAPNLFTSRWASDSDDEDGSLTEEKIKRSFSLESGEIVEFEGVRSDDRSGSVLSTCGDEDKDCKLESGNLMDTDDMSDGDDTVDQSDLDVEEPAGSGMDMLLGCRSVFEYERLNKISEGTYGVVYRAKDKRTGEIVALKKVKNLDRRDMEEYGFPVTSLREINILACFHHPSIVKVKEVVVDDHDNVYMVMEYMEHDLKLLMDSMKHRFSTSDVKSLMLQLLEGVKYLHDNWVLHRDLKTSNILFNNQGELKICDFGMARLYGSPLKPYTTKVVTQWYRAPELLLGAKKYSTAVDMWSVGCIMAEMLSKEPLFKGTSEIDQLRKIFDTLGAPNEKIWPGFSKLPGAKANYSKQPYNLLRKKFPAASFTGAGVLSDAGFDLLNRLLTFDPEKRITADDALNHDWFQERPLPQSKELLPTFPPKV